MRLTLSANLAPYNFSQAKQVFLYPVNVPVVARSLAGVQQLPETAVPGRASSSEKEKPRIQQTKLSTREKALLQASDQYITIVPIPVRVQILQTHRVSYQ